MTTKNTTMVLAEPSEKGADADLLDDRVRCAASDGRGEFMCGRLRGTYGGTHQQPQWLPRTTVGYMSGLGGSEDPKVVSTSPIDLGLTVRTPLVGTSSAERLFLTLHSGI